MTFKYSFLILVLAALLGNTLAIADQALTPKEAKTLIYMAEEEKIARDVYRTLYEKWNIQIFSNISNSEQRHMDRLLSMLKHYQIPVSIVDTTGKFNNPDLAGLYNMLTSKGQSSVLDALQIAAFIEEQDIQDLQTAITESDHADLDQTYENLMRASRNHLRAFVGQIQAKGVTYSAQVMPQSKVDKIVNSPNEGHGKGQGAGKGMGHGKGT